MKEKYALILFGVSLASFSQFGIASNATPQYIKNAPQACLITRDTGDKYCLKAGESAGYSLPMNIRGHEVDLQIPSGLKIILSDYDNLSYNRLGTFDSYTAYADLEHVKARNGEYLDFSSPHSMRVIATKKVPEACIISKYTGE